MKTYMPHIFEGKTALITGGAVRIGRAVCLELARNGADIVIHYNRSKADAEKLADDIQGLGRRAFVACADLGDLGSLNSFFQYAWEIAGKIDILVNNASIFDENRFEDFNLDDLMRNIRINAWAPMLLSRQFVSKANSGHIVNLLDTRVEGYDWKHIAYHASKTLLELFTREMALSFAPGFAVNAVAPGLVLPPPGKGVEYLENLKGSLPLQRVGSAEEVAKAVAFLAASNFITGQTIFIDGGRHLKGPANGQNTH